ncbi:DUF4304 domain-containing protein [Micromonospora cremea]|uniref:DUF4304 domain-containing protein n=1 Tax=Micromonospora cremea TaxID=709881 RepID=A0A1N5WSM3_9ACTN|nr:DUF4304 domain-containing protein [Micromonospora cremea]SIM88184.1 protein of unknown function [Micromonospora cremea]
MGDVRATYRAMLRDDIAPALRALGFSSRYSLPDPESWALLGFQSSRFNTSESLTFTVNLCAVSRLVWESRRREQGHLPEKPSPRTFYGHFVWSCRLGHVMPVDKDVWWNLDEDAEAKGVASEVVAAISAYGLPSLRERL